MKIITLSLMLVTFMFEVKAQQDSSGVIMWPPEYSPLKSKFYVYNQIVVDAPPNKVWEVLVNALRWESWYKGAKNILILNQTDSLLKANAVFRWETMGLKFESTVKEFEKGRLLAWESKKKSIKGYHVWLMVPTQNGCKVITAESQTGWLTFFEKTFQGKKLWKLHNDWLKELKNQSEKGI